METLDAVRVQEPDARGIGDLGFHKKSLRLFFCGLRVIVCVGDLAKNSYSARDKPDQFNGIQHDLLLLSAKHIGVEGWIRYRGQARQMSKSGFYRAAEVALVVVAADGGGEIRCGHCARGHLFPGSLGPPEASSAAGPRAAFSCALACGRGG